MASNKRGNQKMFWDPTSPLAIILPHVHARSQCVEGLMVSTLCNAQMLCRAVCGALCRWCTTCDPARTELNCQRHLTSHCVGCAPVIHSCNALEANTNGTAPSITSARHSAGGATGAKCMPPTPRMSMPPPVAAQLLRAGPPPSRVHRQTAAVLLLRFRTSAPKSTLCHKRDRGVS